MSRPTGSRAPRASSAPSRLTAYRAKRDPKKTPEPMGKAAKVNDKKKPALPTFVIQEHHARSLHWDFRLERDGVLASWALPKGLPVDPGTNHLAIHVEDHPLDYGSFEGDIPKGEYGAGHVTIWDHGTYDIEKWRTNEIIVVLHGQRASGKYVLFSTGDNKWMIHRMDPPPSNFESMPEHVKPMLTLAGELPASDKGWAYEFKWDGVRAMVYVDGGRVQALTRNDKSLTSTFPELRDIGLHLGSRSAILDGEIVALDKNGRPSFGTLARRLHVTSKTAIEKLERSTPASFFAFDLLYLEGRSLIELPYDERRSLLESLKLDGQTFATPPSITNTSGKDVLRIAQERGLEGVVIKRRSAPYSPGLRTGSWLKVKNFHTQEVVIGGWTQGNGERAGSLGALLLGIPTDNGLTYVGKVGTGFSAATRKELLDLLAPLARKTTPFSTPLSHAETTLAHFVRPELVGEVQFAEWTNDGVLRQPSWRGLRTDKSAAEVVREP
ncbi:MAG TPA: non-homologous end-joining DNA ligase [Acidimicrobiales bacterium]